MAVLVRYPGISAREVAVKTLQTLTPDDAERLQREARAMASVLHPNLALVFGVETWRGTPLLIVELLALGTLAVVFVCRNVGGL